MPKKNLKNKSLVLVLAKLLHETARRQGWLFNCSIYRVEDDVTHIETLTNISPAVGRAKAKELGAPGFKLEQHAFFIDPKTGAISDLVPADPEGEAKLAEARANNTPIEVETKNRPKYTPGEGWSE